MGLIFNHQLSKHFINPGLHYPKAREKTWSKWREYLGYEWFINVSSFLLLSFPVYWISTVEPLTTDNSRYLFLPQAKVFSKSMETWTRSLKCVPPTGDSTMTIVGSWDCSSCSSWNLCFLYIDIKSFIPFFSISIKNHQIWNLIHLTR